MDGWAIDGWTDGCLNEMMEQCINELNYELMDGFGVWHNWMLD